MANRPRDKGTIAESGLVGYLRENGWPHAERRALSGGQDKGDISGCIGLAFEVKYTSERLQFSTWLTETGIERINAGAKFGILVVKPPKLGLTRVGQWYAVMWGGEFDRLRQEAETNAIAWLHPQKGLQLSIVDGKPETFSVATLPQQLRDATRVLSVPEVEVPVLALRPKGTKEKPESWYRVTTLAGMVRILRMAGYGDPEVERDRDSAQASAS